MLKAQSINKSYGKLHILKGVDLEVKRGEIVTIVGASGAGKSSLLNILGTLDNPDSGQIFIDGVEVSKLNNKNLSAFRNQKIGFIFQFHHLLIEFNALENVCIPAFIAGVPRAEAERKATGLLDMLGLGDRLTHKPAELSGGEQQRVAVARALINDPALIFADEPSGNLDSKNALELHELFVKLRNDFNQTFVIVTHNQDLSDMSDRTILMKDGLIVNNLQVKILITSAASAGAHKLKATLNNNDVILGDYKDLPAFMGMLKLPNPATDTYTHEMLTLCLDNDISTVYLLNQQEASVLLLSEQLFNEYNINIINGSDHL